MNKNNQMQIRNSTVDFLIFTRQNDENEISVRVEDENVWLRSEAMAELFLKDRRTIQEHLKNIFADGELDENSVCRIFRHTADVIQDKTYRSDFDKLVEQTQNIII
jgi:hypothetical protein